MGTVTVQDSMSGHTHRHATKAITQTTFAEPGLVHGINPDPNTTPPRYAMREIPGKGMGLVATAPILRGDLILANTASLMIDYRAFHELAKPRYTALQAAAVSHLPPSHQSLILSLSAHIPDTSHLTPAELIDAILATNSFDIDPHPDDPADQHNSFFALFPDVARLNHDCRPNAEYRFDYDTLAQHVHAARDIWPGEEITLSYINGLMVRSERVDRLKKNWGFECSIGMILRLREELRDWKGRRTGEGEGSRACPEMAELLVSLLDMERLWGVVHEAYALAALEYNAVGEAWLAVKYARLAVEYGTPMLGEKDEDLMELRKLAENPWSHWSWEKRLKEGTGREGGDSTYPYNVMAAESIDPAKAIEAIREARPPATDRFTYLTIVEANLCPEVLPTLNEVLQDAELTQEIGWDLVYNLVGLPGSESCLETIARLGNPREVILKTLETLELLGEGEVEDGEEEEEEDGEKEKEEEANKPEPVVSPTHKFITLLGMLAILHKRIKTKYPSRFLAQTLHTVISAYRPSQERTAAVINLLHSLSGQRRPSLPARRSTVRVANPDEEGDASRNAADPEAGPDEREDPSESDLQQKLLLSFATCILEAYANGNEMAWAARLLEFYNPEKMVPGRRTLMAAYREEQELSERDAIVGKLAALIGDLGLDSCSKPFTHQLCEGPMHSTPLEEPNLSSPDKIALSTGGCACAAAYRVFSSTVFDASHPSPEMHIFPDHFAVLDKFLQDDAHGQIQKSPGTIEALLTIGLWLLSNNLLSPDPSSPLANPTSSPEDPTSDFMRYIHLTTLIALYHPALQVRNAASVLAGQVLHANPEVEDRLRILEDLLENCMFASLKARAVAWLREELLAAAADKPQKESPPQQQQQEQQFTNPFATSQALETVQYVVFPPLTPLLDLPTIDLVEYLVANVPFLMQAVNFALFLWDAEEEEEQAHRKGLKPKEETAAGRKRESNKEKEDRLRRFRIANEHFNTKGRISKRDGRLNISLRDTSNTGYLAKALGTAARKMVPLSKTADAEEQEDDKAYQREAAAERSPQRPSPSSLEPKPKPTSPISYPVPPLTTTTTTAPPKPSLPPPRLNIVIMIIGSRGDLQPFLKIAAQLHTTYHHRVRIATHPAFESIVSQTCPGVEFFSVGGDPSELMSFMVKNPGMIPTLSSVKAGDMFEGFWRACEGGKEKEKGGPFVADAIIANPPCFAHIHCAEALGVPLHLMFTFPYTPTQAFPHPLARIKRSNVEEGYTNWISYPLVEMMVWQGLGDLVNEFRVKTLGLDPVSTLWAPGSTYRLHVPFTYLWSPGLIDVAGFVFELVKFLEEGDEPPVYIGFGSIVAVKMAGVRALDVPPEVYLLDNTPHDWLFPKVRACVIHGGAGTVAAALKCGKPTMIVPFFGDQHFWGSMVGNAGAGPEAVPYKSLTVEKLADGIKYCITDKARREAERIARDIEKEGDGAEKACQAFHRHLALQGRGSMRCPILPDRVAVWQTKITGLRLSTLATEILVSKGLWNDFEGPGEPLTGVAGALMTSVGKIFGGFGGERREKKKRRGENKKGEGDSKESKPDGPAHHPDNDQNVPPADSTADGMHRRDAASTMEPNLAEDVSGKALVKTPVDLALALAQGFHNAGRLYGDKTVRRPTRITGIRSGLRAARREFIYGIYDGWTGVDGACGFISGVGMGLTGFILKNLAALIGPETESRPRPVKFIRRVRVLQGQRELSTLTEDERAETVKEVKLKRAEKKQGKGVKESLHRSARRLRESSEWDIVFENVEVAQRAIEALKRGEGLERILEMGEADAAWGKEESTDDKAIRVCT
ncbi:glycosyltransferase family 1 protein [Parathielavia appendiculata]|uniref:Glycosyltransferase family 1 protein n=1 Tax=Parathielavia appendiculata TaxID=2587402 RepID=A0AAN6TYK2_9PEZI|nr:glycosyltransferase family 1 protein [Parathielavia appendiculata]